MFSPHRRISVRPALALAAVAALTLSGCAGNDTVGVDTGQPLAGSAGPVTADDETAPVELTVFTGQADEWAKILDARAAEFKQLHPNVTVKMVQGASVADQLLQKLSAAFASGQYPNASYTFGSWATELEQSGHALDITANVKESSAHWDGFNEAMQKTASPNGRTIAFPAIADSLSLFYNKSLFDEAGLPYPTKDTTWPQFRELAKQLHNPAKAISGTAVSVATNESGTWQMWPQLWQNGGAIYDRDTKEATFNSDAGVQAVDFWRQMAQEDKTVYLDQADKASQLFGSGKIGMLIAGPWIAQDMMAAGVKYDVAPLPNTNGNNESVAGIDNWALFDSKDNNQNYWTYTFFEWLTSPEIDPKVSIANNHLPLREAAMSSDAFKAKAQDVPGYQAMADNLVHNVKHERPVVNGYVELSAAFSEAVSKILQGQVGTQDGLDAAAAKATAALQGR